MDRNENQNSYRNTRRKRGNTKAHEGLKRRVNVLMVLVILLIAAIAAILYFGNKEINSLKKEVKNLQNNEQLPNEDPEVSAAPEEITPTPEATPPDSSELTQSATPTPEVIQEITPTPTEPAVTAPTDNQIQTSADVALNDDNNDLLATDALTDTVNNNVTYLGEFQNTEEYKQQGDISTEVLEEKIFPIQQPRYDDDINEYVYENYNLTRKLAIKILQKKIEVGKIDGILGKDTLETMGLNRGITTEISKENYNNIVSYQDVIDYLKEGIEGSPEPDSNNQ